MRASTIVILLLVILGTITVVSLMVVNPPQSKSEQAASTTPPLGGEPTDTQTIAEPEMTATYSCQGDKTIVAGFSQGQVTVDLSDGRAFTLEQTVSASGARYASEGEEVIFWNQGTTATFEEKGVMTYTSCEEQGRLETEGMMIDGTPNSELDNDMVEGSGEVQVQ